MTYTELINKLPPSVFAELQALMDKSLWAIFPAAALHVRQHGETLFEGCWGYIDADARQHPITPHSLFDFASVTKTFTTTAFLSLVSEGKVRLDDPIISVIPEFGGVPRGTDGGPHPFTKEMLPGLEDMRGQTVDPSLVTFRHLLTHTSGLAPWRALYLIAGNVPPMPPLPDPESIEQRWQKTLAAICASPFVDVPGRSVRYSDLGYILLGMSVARLHGTTLETALKQRIFAPLGLNSICYVPLQKGIAQENIVPTEFDATWRVRRLWGEVDDENTGGMGGVSGHAGLYGALEDVAAFGLAWLTHDKRLGIAPELMDDAQRQHAQTADERRGLGWKLGYSTLLGKTSIPDAGVYGHSGFTGTSLRIDPRRDLVITYLTNRVYLGRDKDDIHTLFHPAIHQLLAGALS
ncbi:MAG: serine hydrolase domain-containing protein [Anaerolineae bacterium]